MLVVFLMFKKATGKIEKLHFKSTNQNQYFIKKDYYSETPIFSFYP